jgi:hypothetical protein
MKLTIWFLCLIILFTCCTWQGVLKHGFGFWDDIFADISLGFPDAIGDYFSIAQSAFCPAVILRPLPSSQDTISGCHLPVCLPVCWVCLDLMEKIAYWHVLSGHLMCRCSGCRRRSSSLS